MSDPCITCGGVVEPMSDGMRRAKTTLGLPLTPAKRCAKCVWASLRAFADSPDEEPSQPSGDGSEGAISEVIKMIDERIDAINLLRDQAHAGAGYDLAVELSVLGKLADDIGKRWPGTDPCAEHRTDSATGAPPQLSDDKCMSESNSEVQRG